MNRNKLKANGLKTLSGTILTIGTLTAGLAAFDLFNHLGQSFGVVAAITLAFAAARTLAPVLTGVFGPLIDRATHLPARDDTETETAR